MTKTKKYLKWLFSRWYLYVLVLLDIIFFANTETVLATGLVAGTILLWAIIISIFVGIKKLIKKK